MQERPGGPAELFDVGGTVFGDLLGGLVGEEAGHGGHVAVGVTRAASRRSSIKLVKEEGMRMGVREMWYFVC